MNRHFKQFLKFSLVGGLNTVLDTVLYILLTRVFLLHYLLANVISFVASATNSFFLNRKFTFKVKEKKKYDYTKFLFVALGGLLISESVLYVVVSLFELSDIYGKLLAIFFTVLWNFFGAKLFVFKNRHEA